MRDLAKSVFAFPWAASMFGLQQVVTLVAPPAAGRVAGTVAALDEVTRAAERDRDGWLEQTLALATSVQRGLVDVAMLRALPLDASGLMRLATDPRLAPLLQTTAAYGLPPLAWLDSLRVARADQPAALWEFANKLQALPFVSQARARIDLPPSGDESLATLVDRAAAHPAATRLWLIEALGRDHADRALEDSGGADPLGLLTGESVGALGPSSLAMLHAGAGISFAMDVLGRLDADASPALVRHAISRFAALCRRSSRPGCAGAAFESLGLAARTTHPPLVPAFDREIPSVEPELHAYFWHGAGRAMYFDPTNLLPSSNAPLDVIGHLDREASHDVAYRNALSGIAWATTLVNMQTPEVMELLLRHHRALAASNDAFSQGIASAAVIRHDATPDDEHVGRFVAHEPQVGASAWRSLVAAPCRVALDRGCQAGAIEELFRYRPGAA